MIATPAAFHDKPRRAIILTGEHQPATRASAKSIGDPAELSDLRYQG
jgi:hypothetical protein